MTPWQQAIQTFWAIFGVMCGFVVLVATASYIAHTVRNWRNRK